MPVIGGTQTWQFGGLVSLYNGTGGIASLLGLLALPWLVNRAGKKSVFIALFVMSIASTAAFYFLRPGQIGLIFGLNLAGSITGGPLSALLWAMYADTADFGEWKRGRRATGLIFSASILSQKMGWAFGGTLALLLMAGVGFQANAVQTPESLHGLVLLMSLIPAAFGLVALVLVACYPLGEARMGRIAAELISRRRAEYPAEAGVLP
jgi:GPH family glycoside/pentoside/hexuronide:cation symporter